MAHKASLRGLLGNKHEHLKCIRLDVMHTTAQALCRLLPVSESSGFTEGLHQDMELQIPLSQLTDCITSRMYIGTVHNRCLLVIGNKTRLHIEYEISANFVMISLHKTD